MGLGVRRAALGLAAVLTSLALYALAVPPASLRPLAGIALGPLLGAARATGPGGAFGLGVVWNLAVAFLVVDALPDTTIVSAEGDRAPHISNMAFAGVDSESMLMQLDLEGIACASGSACNTGVVAASHVLEAMRVDPAAAVGALRFSFALSNTMREVERVAAALPEVVEKTRRLTASLERS
jgi:hypothetical protein